MKVILKLLLWAVILFLSWYLGISLLGSFIWWKMLLFYLAAHIIGQISYRLFRWIDRQFSR